ALPGTYALAPTGSGIPVPFIVKADGTVDYPAASEAMLSGRGTSTLVVNVILLTIDARALSQQFGTFLLDNFGGFPTSQLVTFPVWPGSFLFQGGSLQFQFVVTLGGTVDFDHALDGQVGGRGTPILVIL